MSTTTDSSTPTVENRHDSVDKSSEETPSDSRAADTYAYQAAWNQPQVKVQLRPVSHPSPVTQLFEYTLKAWNQQKGDHCTYKYVSSRDPSSPMEITATVLVRLPQKQPLLIRDTKSRSSRVQAQNAVAQLALERLAMEDTELEAQLEAIRKDQAAAPPPPPAFNRYQSSPGRYLAPRGMGHYPQPHFQQMYHAQYYGYPPATAPYFAAPPRSNSAPELQEDPLVSPPPPPAFYGMPPQIETAYAEEEAMIATPTIPYYGYAPMTPQGWGGYHPEMMGGYYQPPPMMMMPPPMHMISPTGEPSREDESTSH